MNIRKILSIMGLMLAFAIMLPGLRADEHNQATKFTFTEPVQIPGRVLPAGSYWFELVDGSDREIVRIYDEDRTLLTTVFAIPRLRRGDGGEVAITLANRGAGQPEAVVAWFYVGETSGHQFLYPKQQARELAHSTQQTVDLGD